MICTYGGNAAYKSLEVILKEKKTDIIGKFGCKGYDTFGPFKLVGGIAKGHPDEKDLFDMLGTKEDRKEFDRQFKNPKSNFFRLQSIAV